MHFLLHLLIAISPLALAIAVIVLAYRHTNGPPVQVPSLTPDTNKSNAKSLEAQRLTANVTANELPQKQQRTGRTRRALRAVRDSVDRHFTTKAVLIATGLLLVASWFYPPWILGSYRNVSHGWFFVFDTTRETAMRVDFGRLVLIDAIIAAIGGLLAWGISGNSATRRVTVRFAFYALIIVPLVGVVCLGAVVIGNIQKRSKASPYDALLAPTWENTYEIVTPNDLGKITLFDVAPVLSFGDSSHVLAFDGRVRNDLPRSIERIGLKASFYNSARVLTDGAEWLIEVRSFWMLGPDWQNLTPVLPNSPVSFHGRVDVENLPVGWTYRLEVIEAHYVSTGN